jgi:hypothetical protein
VHLHDGLVIGIGPHLVSHVRVGSGRHAQPNERYVQMGLSSVITASF